MNIENHSGHRGVLKEKLIEVGQSIKRHRAEALLAGTLIFSLGMGLREGTIMERDGKEPFVSLLDDAYYAKTIRSVAVLASSGVLFMASSFIVGHRLHVKAAERAMRIKEQRAARVAKERQEELILLES